MTGEPIRILLVEDNPHHAELVCESLSEHRIANRIHHVSDGEEALDYLCRRGEYADDARFPTPDLVLLDLRLPKVDGLEVLTEVKADDALKRIPVVVLTSSDAERDLVRAYEHNVNSFLTKPVDAEEFEALMESLGFYWMCWNRYPW